MDLDCSVFPFVKRVKEDREEEQTKQKFRLLEADFSI
jgi:hypothetical protein